MNKTKPIPVLWFGTGSMTKNLLTAVDYTKVQILAFIDEREEMRGRLFDEKPVIGIPQIANYNFKYILVSARPFDVIKSKLVNASIPINKIISLDFEAMAHDIVLQSIIPFDACIDTILQQQNSIYKAFHKEKLHKTRWFSFASSRCNDILSMLSINKPGYDTEKSTVTIAVNIGHSTGDAIIALAWLKELYKQAEYNIKIDVFATLQYVRHLFYNKTYINAVYHDHLFQTAKNYTLKLSIGYFIHVIPTQATYRGQLPAQLREQIDKLNAFVNQYAQYAYGHHHNPWSRLCSLKKWNRWDALGASRAIDFSRNNRIDLDLHLDAFSVLERHNLEDVPFITLHAGGHEWNYPDGTGTKVWPQRRWNEFCRIFKQQHPKILLVQVGDAHSFAMEGVDLCLKGKTTIDETTILLKQALLHIDEEGGLVHMQHQLNGRSVVLFGPTPVDFYGYAQNVNLVSPVCSNCFWLFEDWFTKCPKGLVEAECMEAITAQSVLNAATRCMEQIKKPEYQLESIITYSSVKKKEYEPTLRDICDQCKLELKPISEHIESESGIYIHASKQWEYPFAVEWIRTLQQERNSPLRIADVGGGRGALALYLAGKGHSVTVYDIDYASNSKDKNFNQRFVRSAKEHGYIAEFGSAFNLPEEDEQFDVVVCISVVEHFTRKFYAFKEMLRVLKPGGRLIVTYDLTPEDHCDAYRQEVFTPHIIQEVLRKLNINSASSHTLPDIYNSIDDIKMDMVNICEGMTVGALVIKKISLQSKASI